MFLCVTVDKGTAGSSVHFPPCSVWADLPVHCSLAPRCFEQAYVHNRILMPIGNSVIVLVHDHSLCGNCPQKSCYGLSRFMINHFFFQKQHLTACSLAVGEVPNVEQNKETAVAFHMHY